MSSPSDPGLVRWRVHLASPPDRVFSFLATEEGRAHFWAEAAPELDGTIHFTFSNGQRWRGRILENHPPQRFAIEYFGESRAAFELEGDGAGGTDLTLTESGLSTAEWMENRTGWISVLLALKAAVDFGADLRNHDPRRTWDQSFVDN